MSTRRPATTAARLAIDPAESALTARSATAFGVIQPTVPRVTAHVVRGDLTRGGDEQAGVSGRGRVGRKILDGEPGGLVRVVAAGVTGDDQLPVARKADGDVRHGPPAPWLV